MKGLSVSVPREHQDLTPAIKSQNPMRHFTSHFPTWSTRFFSFLKYIYVCNSSSPEENDLIFGDIWLRM